MQADSSSGFRDSVRLSLSSSYSQNWLGDLLPQHAPLDDSEPIRTTLDTTPKLPEHRRRKASGSFGLGHCGDWVPPRRVCSPLSASPVPWTHAVTSRGANRMSLYAIPIFQKYTNSLCLNIFCTPCGGIRIFSGRRSASAGTGRILENPNKPQVGKPIPRPWYFPQRRGIGNGLGDDFGHHAESAAICMTYGFNIGHTETSPMAIRLSGIGSNGRERGDRGESNIALQ